MAHDGIFPSAYDLQAEARSFKWAEWELKSRNWAHLDDSDWVCENHPDQPAHKCKFCYGAGMPPK